MMGGFGHGFMGWHMMNGGQMMNGSAAAGTMMNGGQAWMAGHWWIGLIAMGIKLLIAIAVIVLAVYLIRRLAARGVHASTTYARALDILNERYARGEIDTEDYQTRKKDLLG